MKIGFVGAGKVGFSMGRFFSERGIQVIGYWSRHLESAKEAAHFTETKAFESLAELVHESDVIFLTVPDGVITPVYLEIAAYGIQGKEVCHCSGAMSAEEAFPGIHEAGAYACSIHPLFPVSSKYEAYKELPGAFFCLQGDETQIYAWKEWFGLQNISAQIIDSESKIKYHAACAIASNLVCGLIQESLEMLQTCGFSEKNARKAITPLVRSNMEHILADGPVKALTGPVERCDLQTIEKHLQCFDKETDEMVYRSVTEKLISLAQEKNPDRDYTAMQKLLKEKK